MAPHGRKLSDLIMIGHPAKGEPILLGCVHNLDLPDHLYIGKSVHVYGRLFTFDVSYVPSNPKKERVIPLLVPKEDLPPEFWTMLGVERFESTPPPTKEEEYPF